MTSSFFKEAVLTLSLPEKAALVASVSEMELGAVKLISTHNMIMIVNAWTFTSVSRSPSSS